MRHINYPLIGVASGDRTMFPDERREYKARLMRDRYAELLKIAQRNGENNRHYVTIRPGTPPPFTLA